MMMAIWLASSAPQAGRMHVPLFVLLADHHRRIGAAEELLLHLRLDQRALLLDDQDRLQAFGEAVHAVRLERPGNGDLVEPDPEVGGALFVDAEEIERAQRIEPAFSERDDAEARTRAASDHDAVELVGANEGEHRRPLPAVQQLFLFERVPPRPDVEAAGRRGEIGNDRRDPIERSVDHAGQFDVVLDAFDPGPDAGKARQRPAHQCRSR